MLKRIRLDKKIWIFFLAAELFILVAAAVIYNRKEPVHLNFAQNELIYDSGESGAYIDTSFSSTYIASQEFILPVGMYRVTIDYDYCDPVIMSVNYMDGRYDSNVSGNIPANNRKRSICDFRIKYEDRPVQIRGRLRGDAGADSYLLIKNISITDSPLALRNFLFKLFLFFCLIDLSVVLVLKRNIFKVGEEEKRIFRALLAIVFIGSIPLMMNYLISGHDLQFHLMRIEGIKSGIQSRTFPVKIQPDWLSGHGYASSVFYGDVFLYIPAILRIFGITVQRAYQFYVLLVNIATVFVSYYCFSKMSTRKAGIICAALYSLNIYRLTCLYTRAAVGEYTAMIFLPVVLYGLWEVYVLPENTKEHKLSWITIAVGYSGIISSHLISCEMVALFTIFACLILWKKTFSKKNFGVLVKAVLAIVLLNIWFLVPLLDYLVNGVYNINAPDSYAAFRLDERTSFPAQLFMNAYGTTETAYSYSRGMKNEMPQTLGVAFLLVFIFWFIWGMGKKDKESDKNSLRLCLILGITSLVFTTYLLPYTVLAKWFPFLEFPERSLQYPWRFLSIAALFFTWFACLLIKNEKIEQEKRKFMSAAVVVVAIWQGVSFMSSVLNESTPAFVYQQGNFTSFEVSGGEYLPVGSNQEDYVDALSFNSDLIDVENWERDYNRIAIELRNKTTEEQEVEIPLLYYKGYEAVTEDGEKFVIYTGLSGRIKVEIPSGFVGKIKVMFKEPWYWRLCEACSLSAVLLLVILFLFKKEV